MEPLGAMGTSFVNLLASLGFNGVNPPKNWCSNIISSLYLPGSIVTLSRKSPPLAALPSTRP